METQQNLRENRNDRLLFLIFTGILTVIISVGFVLLLRRRRQRAQKKVQADQLFKPTLPTEIKGLNEQVAADLRQEGTNNEISHPPHAITYPPAGQKI